MILPVLAIAGTAFLTAILGFRVVQLPHLPFEGGLAAILAIAILGGLYRPTLAMVTAAGFAAVAGVAAAWLVVLLVDPRDPGESILVAWFTIGLMTAGAAGVGRLVAPVDVGHRTSSGQR